MTIHTVRISLFAVFATLIGCKNKVETSAPIILSNNAIKYSKNLSINDYEGYSVVKVINPWLDAKKNFTYILKEKNGIIPDSLQNYQTIQVPIQSIIVTSTTNIPFLEMLGVETKLKGFPHTDYVSSEKTRKLIDQKIVKNVGENEKLNMEQIIDLAPELIVYFGLDDNNQMMDNLQKSGLQTMVQGDWMEQTPLGKAEWIKLYGALFCKEKLAETLFNDIVTSYNEALTMVKTKKATATVLYGTMYEDLWYVPKGESWVAKFMKDAQSNYIWAALEGSGSKGLSFENILEKGKNADFWIAAGTFQTLTELAETNPHYNQFDAFKNKKVFTFEGKLGATGGTIYYELAPSRPDLVLKDYIKIFHPELLPNYQFTFAQQLK
jgi:iron complex transport system substrate-binding protein